MTINEPMMLSPWRGDLVPLLEPVTPGISVQNSWVLEVMLSRPTGKVCEDLPETPRERRLPHQRLPHQTRPSDILVSLQHTGGKEDFTQWEQGFMETLHTSSQS